MAAGDDGVVVYTDVLGRVRRRTLSKGRLRPELHLYWRLLRALAGPDEDSRKALHEEFRRLGLAPLYARWPGIGADESTFVEPGGVLEVMMRRHAARLRMRNQDG